MVDIIPDQARKGRGAVSNRPGRFEPHDRVAIDDGWHWDDDEMPPLRTSVTDEKPKTIIARNKSPDIPFDRSINPYRGCEHGCVYCFARPTHAYYGLSPGLDFESRLFAKPNAAELLESELSKPSYRPRVMALGSNTDPYQPIERERKITRCVLEVLQRFNHPVGIVTKSPLVLRDLDIIGPMAEQGLASVALSVTTLDATLARTLEPRAPRPDKRLDAMRQLSAAGVPTIVMAAPMIPALNDHELEAILDAAAERGATRAGYILVRLPLEIKDLFTEWLQTHQPDRARHVLNNLRQSRDGQLYVAGWGSRMKGNGPLAEMLEQRFKLACKRLGLIEERSVDASRRVDLFRRPPKAGDQLDLL